MREESIVWEKIIFQDEYARDTIIDENEALYYKIGNYVKKKIKEINNEDTDVLLAYPVVYLHTWENDANAFECYIGETIDLLRRTEEHEKAGEDFRNWQSSWVNGKNKISYYFSSIEMNKSLCLDLENCLIDFISNSPKNKGYNNFTCNGRNNEQPSYSNKNKRNELLKSIWTVIQHEAVFNGLENDFVIENYIESNIVRDTQCASNDCDTLSDDNFLFFANYEDSGVIRDEKSFEAFSYIKWPVVYMHIWKDDEGLHIYTGEANEICKRTTEHVNKAKEQTEKIEKAKKQAEEEFKKSKEKAKINEEEIKQAVEKHEMVKQAIADADWHMKWGEAVKNSNACMIVIGHDQFNKSITLDLENMLFEYTDKLDLMPDHTTRILVENGRGNEQRRYDNERYLLKFFDSVINYICNKDGKLCGWLKKKDVENGVFKSLEYMRENAIFIASTMHKLSENQLSAKLDILKKINERSNKKSLMIIKGGWGTGKTVVAASLFFELLNAKKDVFFVMNHDQLMNVYKNQAIAREAGKKTNNNPNAIVNRITKAEKAINVKENFEIVIIDEGHLLYEKNNNGIGEQLKKIIKKANTVILLYDPDQHTDYVSMYDDMHEEFDKDDDLVKYFIKQLGDVSKDIDINVVANLTQQFRMDCSDKTINWLISLTKEADIIEFPFNSKDTYYEVSEVDDYNKILEYDSNGNIVFEIDIVNSLDKLDELILDKKRKYTSTCFLSTYNYHYGEKKTVPRLFLKNKRGIYHGWHITGKDRVWFREASIKETDKFVLAATRLKDCVVYECKNGKQSYYEVGAVQDIQGFDLEYAGVIIGESWKYDNNKVTIDLSKVAGKNYQNNGGEFSGKQKKKAVSNELGVLLSRGKKGLVIYAVNTELREKLIAATKKGKNC